MTHHISAQTLLNYLTRWPGYQPITLPCQPLIVRTSTQNISSMFNKALLKTPADCFEYPVYSYLYIWRPNTHIFFLSEAYRNNCVRQVSVSHLICEIDVCACDYEIRSSHSINDSPLTNQISCESLCILRFFSSKEVSHRPRSSSITASFRGNKWFDKISFGADAGSSWFSLRRRAELVYVSFFYTALGSCIYYKQHT